MLLNLRCSVGFSQYFLAAIRSYVKQQPMCVHILKKQNKGKTPEIFYSSLGNCDRLAGVLSAVEREGGWAPLSSHVAPHVARSQQDGGSLVLLDNGAGTLDAYNLLYPHSHNQEWRLNNYNFICALNFFY